MSIKQVAAAPKNKTRRSFTNKVAGPWNPKGRAILPFVILSMFVLQPANACGLERGLYVSARLKRELTRAFLSHLDVEQKRG